MTGRNTQRGDGLPSRVREVEVLGVTVTQFSDGYEALLPSGEVLKTDTIYGLLWKAAQMNAKRLILLGGVALSLGAVVIAHHLQTTLNLFPCSLCILQRYMFIFLAMTTLGSVFKPRWFMPLGTLAALAGLSLSARQLYVMAHPSMTCGRDWLEEALNALPSAELAPSWFQVTGLCGDKLPDVVGLPIPIWALIVFITVFSVLATLVATDLRKRKSLPARRRV